MSVAGRQKTILVTGDRVWRDGQPSEPQPFESMPLVWERAFGGVHRNGEKVLARSATRRMRIRRRSFAGRHAGACRPEPRGSSSAPASRWGRSRRQPASRRLHRRGCRVVRTPGPTTNAWQRSRAPYLPDDFDPRFFQCAAPEFAFDRYLQSGRTCPDRRRDAGWSDRVHRAGLTSERGRHRRRDRCTHRP